MQKRRETAGLGGLLCALLLAAVSAVSAADEKAKPKPKPWRIEVATQRGDALYALEEPVQFMAEVFDAEGGSVDWGSIDYRLSVDGYRPLEAHSLALTGAPLVIEGSFDRPGFLRVDVSFKGPNGQVVSAAASAGISVGELTPSREPPVDFEDFWSEQKARLAEVPLAWSLAEVETGTDDVVAADVQVDSIDEVPVSGYIAWPRDAAEKSLPIVLWVHGAGVRSSSLPQAVNGAKEGFLSMDINAHGLPNGQEEGYYRKLAKEDLENYWFDGRGNRDGVYFKNMFLRMVRAIDYLTSRSEWDGRTVAVVGHSQGGAQALVAGGLDQRVTFIGAGVPAMCDHTGMLRRRVSGWPKLVPILEDGKPDPVVAEVSRYFDAVNFAARCHAEAIVSIGYLDRACPPTSCYVAYNQLKGDKRLIAEPAMGHEAPAEIRAEFLAALKAHVGSVAAAVGAQN